MKQAMRVAGPSSARGDCRAIARPGRWGGLAGLVGALALGACATVTTGTTHTVAVETYPTGASCQATREGVVVGSVAPTPGSFTVDKSAKALTVTCKRDGFDDAVATVDAVVQPMTVGNVLAGGVIGIAVDAATGASMVYEDLPTVVLVPTSFATVAARDQFFGGAIAAVKRRAAHEMAAARQTQAVCAASTQQVACATFLKARATRRDAEIARIEDQRQQAHVATVSN